MLDVVVFMMLLAILLGLLETCDGFGLASV